jgi:hypothetical protein
VTDGTNGVGGIRISTDAGGSATTGSDGTYTLNIQLPAGTYSVFPRQVSGMMICPTNQLVTLGPDATNVNFSTGVACITALSRINNGQIALSLMVVPNGSCLIEASTNLTIWEILCTTNAPANGLMLFLDTNATAFPSRFYRAVSP